ncbi:tRNA (adenine-N(1)-)-methyltransferase catalytic subunit trm61 [Oleoguttula sp. CCFEE 5521]
MPSPFFHTPPVAEADSLAVLHLRRENLVPITLRATADDGYAEGAVTNTRFGSFPHTTFIGSQWGSQVRASKVDTGTRGRKLKEAKLEAAARAEASATLGESTSVGGGEDAATRKRKSNGSHDGSPLSPTKKVKQVMNHATAEPKAAVEAGSGFAHLVQPTPESWTSSLDHRTQVVYTPDYSYVLQRLRVKPGDTIIEAGAGSGSFTHAAARAVFNGYPRDAQSAGGKYGRVCSFEYHAPRVGTLRQEITDHGLDGVVTLTHRDVYNLGFLLADDSSPRASAIFLDLPAPWKALGHITRESPTTPLDPDTVAHICTFSPCIEQVQATMAAMRKAGWIEIQMVEVMNKRIDVRRERVGLKEEGLRGVNANPATVEESIGRLREIEAKLNEFHAKKTPAKAGDTNGHGAGDAAKKTLSKAERLLQIKQEVDGRKLYKEGNLAHRTESEVKTHTSYLVFAILPMQWDEKDELALLADEASAGDK